MWHISVTILRRAVEYYASVNLDCNLVWHRLAVNVALDAQLVCTVQPTWCHYAFIHAQLVAPAVPRQIQYLAVYEKISHQISPYISARSCDVRML